MPERKFYTLGKRLIDCDLHCPKSDFLEVNPQITIVRGVDGVNGWLGNEKCILPACHAKGSPRQEKNRPEIWDSFKPPDSMRICMHHIRMAREIKLIVEDDTLHLSQKS